MNAVILRPCLAAVVPLEDDEPASLLGAALEAIAHAALVLDADGHVVEANGLARASLAQGGSSLLDALAALAGEDREDNPEWSVKRVVSSRFGLTYLVVARRTEAGIVAGRVAVAGGRWGLSPRQREVLAKVAEGNANKTIAAMLRVSVRTVEVHLTALFSKAQVGSRAELIAKLWIID